MKRIVLFLAITAMIFSFQEIHSQSLRDRVKKAVFKEPVEAQSEADSATVIETDDSTEPSSTNFTNRVMMNAMGLTGNVDYEPVYSFDAHIQMEISEYKKNGTLDNQMLYDSYVHKEDADYAMEFSNDGSKSIMIFDTKNSAMLILTNSDGEKSGFATSIDPETMAEEAEAYEEEDSGVDSDPFNYKKTGKTKNILGYSCDEYLMEDEATEVRMWVSEKLGKEMRKEWMNNKQTFGAMFSSAYALNGMVMEYDFLDKEDGDKMVMQVTKIDLNQSHTVSTEGYTIMSMKQQTEEE
jgi:hypothetical protein